MDTSADRITDVWGSRTPYGPGTSWPPRTDIHLAAGLGERDVERHAARLADAGRDHGLDLPGPRGNPSPGALAALREKASEALGRRPGTGLLLLNDLRELHLAVARNSLHWEMPAQAAQAGRDDRLLALVTDCHPQKLRHLRWTNTMIKILAPQLLTGV
ncbi:hypothetical protein [Streptomyces paradoxus]|uniref:hypothetical protein n=1 Tax=Streptomyces paradoxus TaxID=66375 RepID=UPI0037F3689A